MRYTRLPARASARPPGHNPLQEFFIDPPFWFVVAAAIVGLLSLIVVVIQFERRGWRVSDDEEREIQIILSSILSIAVVSVAGRSLLELELLESLFVGVLLGFGPIRLAQTDVVVSRARDHVDDLRVSIWFVLLATSIVTFLSFSTRPLGFAAGMISVVSLFGFVFAVADPEDMDSLEFDNRAQATMSDPPWIILLVIFVIIALVFLDILSIIM